MTSKADRKVSECAVSLYWLYDFVAKRQSDLNDLCTQDVVTQIIMPETQTANCRYVDLLPDSYVSTPTYFACHVWTAPFLDLVNSFRQFFNEDLEECKGIYIWIDIFAINQNVPGNLNEDLKVLPTIIQNATKGALICLDVDNTLLTRSWCLYEIWTAHSIAADRVKLIDNHQIDYAKLKDVFAQCDITTAEAAYLADQDYILKLVQDEHSVVKVNSSIRKTLVESARKESQDNTIYQETNPRKMYKSHTKYGNFLGYIEEYDKALLLLERSLEMAEKAVGSLHNDVADVLLSIARVYSDMEKHEDAMPLYRRALGIYEKNLGGENGKTVSAFNGLGTTLCKLEKFNEAIPLYKRSLRKKHLELPTLNNRSKSF